jgi:hypothetical protein
VIVWIAPYECHEVRPTNPQSFLTLNINSEPFALGRAFGIKAWTRVSIEVHGAWLVDSHMIISLINVLLSAYPSFWIRLCPCYDLGLTSDPGQSFHVNCHHDHLLSFPRQCMQDVLRSLDKNNCLVLQVGSGVSCFLWFPLHDVEGAASEPCYLAPCLKREFESQNCYW